MHGEKGSIFHYPPPFLASIAEKGVFSILFPYPPTGITRNTATMNKADIAAKVQEVLGSTKADAERVMETIIDSITGALKRGDEVSIAGLGIFVTKARPAREGRNPRTGETIRIAATRTPKFRPAKGLKDAVK